jgi:hypothetical protein
MNHLGWCCNLEGADHWHGRQTMGVGMVMRSVVVVGTLLLGIGAVMAQQDMVKEAQTTMKGNGKNAGALAAMVKGEKPYN